MRHERTMHHNAGLESSNVWEDFPSSRRLPMCGKASHLWGDLPCMGTSPDSDVQTRGEALFQNEVPKRNPTAAPTNGNAAPLFSSRSSGGQHCTNLWQLPTKTRSVQCLRMMTIIHEVYHAGADHEAEARQRRPQDFG